MNDSYAHFSIRSIRQLIGPSDVSLIYVDKMTLYLLAVYLTPLKSWIERERESEMKQ